MDKKVRSNSVGRTTVDDEDCGPWAKVIKEATAYAFATDDNHHAPETAANSRRRETSFAVLMEEGIQRVDQSLIFLDMLQMLLEQQEHRECPPSNPPIPPVFLDGHHEKDEGTNHRSNSKSKPSTLARRSPSNSKPASLVKSKREKNNETKKMYPTIKSKSQRTKSLSSNRYAMIASDTDDDSDTDNDNAIANDDKIAFEDSKPSARAKIERNLSAEAHPFVPIDDLPSNPEKPSVETHPMDTVRLLIRLHASQSDLHAKKARLLAMQRRWLLGAGSLQSSIMALSKGLGLADNAISAIVAAMDTNDITGWNNYAYDGSTIDGAPILIQTNTAVDKRRAQLEKDAEITSVSSNYLSIQKNRYINLADAKVARLERILRPIWNSRDAAKKRIGMGKWKSNQQPNEYSQYTKTRLKHEEELWSIEEALQHLQDTEESTSVLVDEANQLREKLKVMRFAKNRYNGYHPNLPSRSSPRTVSDSQRRDNKTKLPSYLEMIADDYGWVYTGGIGGQDCVQFFEKWVGFGFKGQSHAAAIPQTIDLPDWSITGYEEPNAETGNLGAATGASTGGSFVLVKLDFYFLTGTVQTVVEYPATYNDAGAVMQHAWSSTMSFTLNKDDIDGQAMYRQILMDPLLAHSLNGSTNVAILPS